MKVLVIGNLGNMGRRYTAILRSLGHETFGFDAFDTSLILKTDCVQRADKIILATPSHNHFKMLTWIHATLLKTTDVLCEKPVVKTELTLRHLSGVSSGIMRLFMVNQYRYLSIPKNAKGLTAYDYYHSGTDGLLWDCIQLIALAKDDIHLRTKSPFWTCLINGHLIRKEELDLAYCTMLCDFLGPMKQCWGLPEIETLTQKVLNYESTQTNFDRNPSEIYLAPATGESTFGDRPKADTSARGGAVPEGGNVLKQ